MLIFFQFYDTIRACERRVGVFFLFSPLQNVTGIFVITKKEYIMNKVSFMGNGETKDFHFNFPFFTKDDVVVTVNEKTQTAIM